MEFPISRERLQNYKVNEAVLVETKQRVLKEIQEICKHIERIVLTTNATNYVYKITSNIKYPNARVSSDAVLLPQPVSCVNEVLVAIKNTFPDSNVIMDPLETYIIIDWS
jgi:hypothetical protein